MAWTVSFNAVDGPEAGTATATWNAGQPDEFAYSVPLDTTNLAAVQKFVGEAQARQQQSVTNKTDGAAKAAAIKSRLETALNK